MKLQMICAVLAAGLLSSHAFARDTVSNYPVEAALKSEGGKVDQDIPLYFSG